MIELAVSQVLFPLMTAVITGLFFWCRDAHKRTVSNREAQREDRRKFVEFTILFDRLLSSLNDENSTFNSRSVQSEMRKEFPYLERN